MIKDNFLNITTICLLLFMASAAGCSDNSTGAGDEEPPAIPEISAAHPDFSYFESDGKEKFQDNHAFGSALTMVLSAKLLSTFSEVAVNFFKMAENESPEFVDGKWVWNYSRTVEGETIEFTLTAGVDQNLGEVNWVFYLSYTGTEVQFQDYKFMEGTTSLDGKHGNWQINAFVDTEISGPVLTYEWDIAENGDLTATFHFPGSEVAGSLVYVQEGGNTHKLTMQSNGSTVELYWDTDAGHGYWWDITNGEKLCWTSDKSTIACSEIGL